MTAVFAIEKVVSEGKFWGEDYRHDHNNTCLIFMFLRILFIPLAEDLRNRLQDRMNQPLSL
jgi:hypothetical protein